MASPQRGESHLDGSILEISKLKSLTLRCNHRTLEKLELAMGSPNYAAVMQNPRALPTSALFINSALWAFLQHGNYKIGHKSVDKILARVPYDKIVTAVLDAFVAYQTGLTAAIQKAQAEESEEDDLFGDGPDLDEVQEGEEKQPAEVPPTEPPGV
jgi:hypothetical protein